jgi:LacI family transcriptional regulator
VHIPWREITQNALHWLLNRCYGSSYPVEREFPVSVTWRSSVVMATN